MGKEELINNILLLFKDFLDEKISGKEMVKKYDDLVADQVPYHAQDDKLKMLSEYQDELAFYVENPEWRKQHDCYYGPEILRENVETFLKKLQN